MILNANVIDFFFFSLRLRSANVEYTLMNSRLLLSYEHVNVKVMYQKRPVSARLYSDVSQRKVALPTFYLHWIFSKLRSAQTERASKDENSDYAEMQNTSFTKTYSCLTQFTSWLLHESDAEYIEQSKSCYMRCRTSDFQVSYNVTELYWNLQMNALFSTVQRDPSKIALDDVIRWRGL